MNSDLLPLNASPQERALSNATARAADAPILVREQWDPDTCPEHLLPWLAWAFSVDEWDGAWPVEVKRQTIREAVQIQARKGTVFSMKRALKNAGYGDATLIEGRSGGLYNGMFTHNGDIDYGDPTAWAEYRVILARPITNTQAEQVRKILNSTAPARCFLYGLQYDQVAFIHNAEIFYDGQFNYGAA